jgi:hypothetical protein
VSGNQITDPTIIEQAIKDVEKPAVKIKTVAPSSSEVTLPGGFINREGALVKYAEVRELNGMDEEAIAKAGSSSRALLVMLQRGLVSIGTEEANKQDLDNLLSGDRDAILIGIRKVTFGTEADFSLTCPHCRTGLGVTVDLDEDVPYRELEDPINDRVFDYESKKHGVIRVSLPTGATQRKLMENTDKTLAELNTILLAGCVDSVNGIVSMGASTVLKLGMADREALVSNIISRNPGPRLGEVSTHCEACGEEIPMPLALTDLFRL